MKSSHHNNLYLLLILFILFTFFSPSFSQITCKCEEIPDDKNQQDQKGQGASQSSSSSSISSSTSAGGGAGAGGSATKTDQGSNKGAVQGNMQGSEELDMDLGINLKGHFTKIFAFGDSYTGGPESNYEKMGYTHRLIIDFVCSAFGLPPLPAYKASSQKDCKSGVNFAIPGASALPDNELDIFTRVGKAAAGFLYDTTQSFLTQITWFDDFLEKLGCEDKDNCKEVLNGALFWLGGMGVDDHARTAGSSYSLSWLKDKSVVHISTMLEDLLESGAKHIVVQGLPPLGCLLFEVSLCPLKKLNGQGCAVAANAATMVHNKLLQIAIQNFQDDYPEAKIVYGDLYGAFMTILQNPGKFHFQETFKACCGSGGDHNFNIKSICGTSGTSKCSDPSKYMFWDGIQLTTSMNKQLTRLVLKQVGSQLIK